MKKIIIILLILIILAGGIYAAVAFLSDDGEDAGNSQDTDSSEFSDGESEEEIDGEGYDVHSLGDENIKFTSLFNCKTVSELQEKATENGFELQSIDDGKYSGLSLDSDGVCVNLIMGFDGDDLSSMSAHIEFATEYGTGETQTEQFAKDLKYSEKICENVFDMPMYNIMKAVSASGDRWELDDPEVYDVILKGEAEIIFIIKENDSLYWQCEGRVLDGKYILYMKQVFENIDDKFVDFIME